MTAKLRATTGRIGPVMPRLSAGNARWEERAVRPRTNQSWEFKTPETILGDLRGLVTPILDARKAQS